LLLFFLVGAALSSLGINVGAALISASVVSGFVLGFAVKDTLGNIASGFMIAITKPFKVGDSVIIAKVTGKVVSVGASVTTLITPDNERVLIPNSKVWGNPITNKTALDKKKDRQ
jgi:small conductance mechanosensitive channel